MSQTLERILELVNVGKVLVLQHDRQGRPVHVVWGIPKAVSYSAVLVTAYRPNPSRWSEDFLRRRQ